jgi:NAD(P)-dependent dehydrogenase (short-subunit alcohol dehydrogenase family)
MLLEGKNAIVYGAGGLGRGVARKFAQEGARVFLASRTPEPLEATKREIEAAGGTIEIAVLDTLDEPAVDEHLRDVVANAGSVDVSFNLTSREDRQVTPLIELSVQDATRAPDTALRSQFITARAAARQMTEQGSGVILTITSGTARYPTAGMGNTGSADAAVEAFMRTLAPEVGPSGVRVVGIYTAGVAETLTSERMQRVTGHPMDVDAVLGALAQATMLKRPCSLEGVTSTAAFLASDGARDITGTIVNVTCGMVQG